MNTDEDFKGAGELLDAEEAERNAEPKFEQSFDRRKTDYGLKPFMPEGVRDAMLKGADAIPVSPLAAFKDNTFTPEEKKKRTLRRESALRVLFTSDVENMTPEFAAGFYQSVHRNLVGLEDPDGSVAFGNRKSDNPKKNIEMLKQFCLGDHKVISSPERRAWIEMTWDQKFKYALEHETAGNAIGSHLKGDRGVSIGEMVAAGAQSGASAFSPTEGHPTEIQKDVSRRLDYESMTPEEKRQYEADVIRDYDERLLKDNRLAAYLELTADLSDKAKWLVAKGLNDGECDMDALRQLRGAEPERALTAIKMARGNQTRGHILGVDTDFSTGTAGDRLQMGLYGFQQGVIGLFADTYRFLENARAYGLAKYMYDKKEFREFSDAMSFQAKFEQAFTQDLPEPESFWGEAYQGVMENLHWGLSWETSAFGKGLMASATGIARPTLGATLKALATKPSAWKGVIAEYGKTLRLMPNAKLADMGKGLAKAEADLMRKQMRSLRTMMAASAEGKEAAKLANPIVGEYLVRQAAAVDRLRRDFASAKRIARWTDGLGAGLATTGSMASFATFAQEYMDNAVAAGVDWDDALVTSVAVGAINAKIENIWMPGIEGGLSRGELGMLTMASFRQALANTLAKNGKAGLKEYFANWGKKYLASAGRAGFEEGFVEEPLQQIVIEHGIAFDKLLKEYGYTGPTQVLKAFLPTADDWKTFVDTAIEMLPNDFGFALTSLPMAVGRHLRNQALHNLRAKKWHYWRDERKRKRDWVADHGSLDGYEPAPMPKMYTETGELSPEMLKGAYEKVTDLDYGVVDMIQRQIDLQQLVKDEWTGEDKGSVTEDPKKERGTRLKVAEKIQVARDVWRASDGTGDVVGAVADALGVGRRTAEVACSTFEAEGDFTDFNAKARTVLNANFVLASLTEADLKEINPNFVDGSFERDEKTGSVKAEILINMGKDENGKDREPVRKTVVYRIGSSVLSDEAIPAAAAKGSTFGASWIGTHKGEIVNGRRVETWDELTDDERLELVKRDRWIAKGSAGPGATVVFTDKDGNEKTIDADFLVSFATGRIGDIGYGVAAKRSTMFHENFHVLWDSVKEFIPEEDRKNLARKLDVDVEKGDWDSRLQEKMAIQLEAYSGGQMVPQFSQNVIEGMQGGIRGALGGLLEMMAPKTIDPKTGKEYGLKDFYDAVLRGDIGNAAELLKAAAGKMPEKDAGTKPSDGKPPGSVTEEELAAKDAETAKSGEDVETSPVANAENKGGSGKGGLVSDVDDKTSPAQPTVRRPSWDHGDRIDRKCPGKKWKLKCKLVLMSVHDLVTQQAQGRDVTAKDYKDRVDEMARTWEIEEGTKIDNTVLLGVPTAFTKGVVPGAVDKSVFAGNTRTSAILKIYENGGDAADAFRASQEQLAEERGLERADGWENDPVVIALLEEVEVPGTEKVPTAQEIADASNGNIASAYGASESAGAHATILIANNLIPLFQIDLKTGEIVDSDEAYKTSRVNPIGEFYRKAGGNKALPDFYRKDTTNLSEDGQRILRNAILSALFGGRGGDTVARLMSEADRLGMQNEMAALVQLAPELLSLANDREHAKYDLRGPLVEALGWVQRWLDADEAARKSAGKTHAEWKRRKDGKPVEPAALATTWENFREGDMTEKPSEEAVILGDLLAAAHMTLAWSREGEGGEERPSEASKLTARRLVTGYVRDYLENVMHATAPVEDGLFAGTEDAAAFAPPTTAEIMRTQRGTRFSVGELQSQRPYLNTNQATDEAFSGSGNAGSYHFPKSGVVAARQSLDHRTSQATDSTLSDSGSPEAALTHSPVAAARRSLDQMARIIANRPKAAQDVFGSLRTALKNIEDGKPVFVGGRELSAKNFVTSMQALGFSRKAGANSAYLVIGGDSVIRASDHSANAELFVQDGADNNLSIVIRRPHSMAKKFAPSDSVNVVEAVFTRRDLDEHPGKLPYIVRDIAEFIATGEYHDTAGAMAYNYSGSDEYQAAVRDRIHADALARGDTATAARMVREAAAKAGYINDSSYQGTSAFNGAAPAANGYYANKEERKATWKDGSFEDTQTLGDYIFDGIDLGDLERRLDHRHWSNARPEHKEAIENLNSVLSVRGKTIRMYRSVPSDVKEGSFRNGDWITPSRSYAVENARIHGWGKKFRIIEQEVSVEDIWWDGNDIAEWGFDDGRESTYKNTKNNRKLLAPATYDDVGNLIPLSQRFNQNKADIRYSIAGTSGAERLGIGTPAAAEKMEASGADRYDIWRKTGWWRGHDGKWRIEVDPPYLASRSKFEFLKGGELVRLGELFPDSSVISAYGLERIPVIIDFDGERQVLNGATAAFGFRINGEEGIILRPSLVEYVSTKPSAGQLRMFEKFSPEYAAFSKEFSKLFDEYDQLEPEKADELEKKIRSDLDATEAGRVYEDIRSENGERFIPSERFLSVMTHEIQHIIQDREGFAQGGNPGLYDKDPSTKKIDERISSLNAELDKVIAAGEDREAFDRLRKEIKDAEDEKLKISKEAHDKAVMRYHVLAGEVEARNVEKRLMMPLEKRLATPPWETEDIKAGDQIVRYSVAASPTLREDVEAALLKRDAAHPDAIQKGRHDEIVFSENIPVFEFLGLPNLRVVTEVSKIRKFAIKHHLSVDQIVDIPNGYDNPVAIMSDDDGYVLLTDRQVTTDDGEQKPMRLFLRPTKWRSGEIVLLATAMAENGRDEQEYYEPRIKAGLMFADENRIAGLNLGEETESILRIQASGDDVKTAADFSDWKSTQESIAKSDAVGNAAKRKFSVSASPSEPLVRAMDRRTWLNPRAHGVDRDVRWSVGGTFDEAFPQLREMSDEELVIAAEAVRLALNTKGKGRFMNITRMQRDLRGLNPNQSHEDLGVRAVGVTQAARNLAKKMRSDLDRGVSESRILAHLPDTMKEVFGSEMTARLRTGAKAGVYAERARKEIERRQEKVIADAVAIQSGVETKIMENAYGLDFSRTLMNLAENPYVRTDENGNRLPPERGEGEEGSAPDEQSSGFAAKPVEAKVAEAVNEVARRAHELSEAEKAKKEELRRQAGRDAENQLAFNQEENAAAADAGEGSGAMFTGGEDLVDVATRKAGVNLQDPRELALFVSELSRKYWNDTHGLGEKPDTWNDPVAMQFLRKTAANVYSKLVNDLVYSQARDTATRAINRFENVPTARGLVSEMTFVGQLIHAKRMADTQREMCNKLDALLKEKFGAAGRFSPDKEELRRTVSAEMELRARYTRHVIWLTPDALDAETEAMQKNLHGIEVEFGDAGRDVDQSKVMVETLRKLQILREFGGLVYKPLAQIQAAIEYWEDALRGDTDRIVRDNYERDLLTEKAAEKLAAAFDNPKLKTALEENLKSLFNDYVESHMGFFVLLRDMMRFAPDDVRAKAEPIIEYLELAVQKAGTRAMSGKRRHGDALAQAVQSIYHRDFQKVLAEFNQRDDRFLEFMGEVSPGKREIPTKGKAMQLFVSLLQVGHPVEVADKDSESHVEWIGGYHDNIVKNHREGQAEKIRRLLSVEDLNLIAWLGKWYEANRENLSTVAEALFGIGVYAETANYMPVKMLLDPQGLEKGNAVGWTIFPRSLTPRIRNERDFDTSADILSMFMSRMEESEQWASHAKLGLELRGIFGRSVLRKSIRASHGTSADKLVQGFITDILSGRGAGDLTTGKFSFYADRIRGMAALGALGGNIGVTLKQTTSIPAFGFELGLAKTSKYILSAWSPDGFAAMREIFESAERKNRWDVGNTEAVKNALSMNASGPLMKALKASMVTNKVGDVVPALVVGQGIYRDALAQGMSREDAMARTWMLIERTQQSSRLENQPEFVRRSRAARALFQFLTTQVQYLGYEAKAIREVMAKPGDVRRWGSLGSVLALNHFLLTSLYFGMGQLWKRLLGQEPPPDDELADWMVTCLLGPFGALYVAGFTATEALNVWVKGKKFGSQPTLPSLSWASNIIIHDPGSVLSAIFSHDKGTLDDVLSAAGKWLADFNATFRDFRKVYRYRVKKEPQRK